METANNRIDTVEFLYVNDVQMIRFFAVILVCSLVTFSCKKGKDDSNTPEALLLRFLIRNFLSSGINSELPNNLAVAIPRSIRKPSSGTVRSASAINPRSKLAAQTKGIAQDTLDLGFAGQAFLDYGTSLVSEILQSYKLDLALISGAYDKAKANPGVCIPGGSESVRITPEIEEEFFLGMERLGLTRDEAKDEVFRLQISGNLPFVGQSVPTPAMVYNKISTGEYDVEIRYTVSESVGTSIACPTNNQFQKTIRFNTEKTRIFSSISRSLSVFGVSLSVDASIKYITEAGKKDKAVLNIKQVTNGFGISEKSTTRFSFEECNRDTNANANNCVQLAFSNIYDDANDNKITTLVKGRTNDTGGYVLTEYIDNGNFYEYYLEETYNQDGEIDYFYVEYYESLDSGSTYEPAVIEQLGSLDLAKYGDLYDTNFDFEWDVFVELVPAPTTSNAAGRIGNGSGFSEYDAFVVMPAGVNPNNFPDEFIGWGEFFNNFNSGGPVHYIDFYGDASQVAGAVIWRYSIDSNGNEVYVTRTNTINKL